MTLAAKFAAIEIAFTLLVPAATESAVATISECIRLSSSAVTAILPVLTNSALPPVYVPASFAVTSLDISLRAKAAPMATDLLSPCVPAATLMAEDSSCDRICVPARAEMVALPTTICVMLSARPSTSASVCEAILFIAMIGATVIASLPPSPFTVIANAELSITAMIAPSQSEVTSSAPPTFRSMSRITAWDSTVADPPRSVPAIASIVAYSRFVGL